MATRSVSRRSATGILALGAVLALAGTASAVTIIVPDDNPSLAAAVAGAHPGDDIQVRPGDYPEIVRLGAGQSFVTIGGLGGRPRFTGANRKDGFVIRGASNVTISGFDFTRRKTAVRLDLCTNCALFDLNITECRTAVRAHNSPGFVVAGSHVTGTFRGNAIAIDRSAGVSVGANVITGTTKGNGLVLNHCDDALILGNQVSDNYRGLVLENATGGTLDSNVTNDNTFDGIVVKKVPGVAVTNNDSNGNSKGVAVTDSPPIAAIADLTGAGNTATGNGVDFFVNP
jgi:parallel beta-helix repeat protein